MFLPPVEQGLLVADRRRIELVLRVGNPVADRGQGVHYSFFAASPAGIGPAPAW